MADWKKLVVESSAGVISQSATTIQATANNSTNEATYITFVDGATGTQGLETDTGLTYNPNSGLLTSIGFVGALTGNADTVTTNADLTGDITSSGNATTIASDVIINSDIKSDAAIAMSKTAFVAGTGVTLTTNTLNVDAAQAGITSIGPASGTLTVGDDLVVTGELTVSGDMTTINTTSVEVSDKSIVLANQASGGTTAAFLTGADGSGINVETMDAGGVVSVTVDVAGSGYSTDDAVTAATGDFAGKIVQVGGAIASVEITNQGKYESAPTLVVSGSGSNGACTAVLSSDIEVNRPSIAWRKASGGGNTDGSGTANNLTGWQVSNSRLTNATRHPIAIMDFGTGQIGAGDNSAGVGSFYFETDAEDLYIRVS